MVSEVRETRALNAMMNNRWRQRRRFETLKRPPFELNRCHIELPITLPSGLHARYRPYDDLQFGSMGNNPDAHQLGLFRDRIHVGRQPDLAQPFLAKFIGSLISQGCTLDESTYLGDSQRKTRPRVLTS